MRECFLQFHQDLLQGYFLKFFPFFETLQDISPFSSSNCFENELLQKFINGLKRNFSSKCFRSFIKDYSIAYQLFLMRFMQEILQRFFRVFILNYSFTNLFFFKNTFWIFYRSSSRGSFLEFLRRLSHTSSSSLWLFISYNTSEIPLESSRTILPGISPKGFLEFPQKFLQELHHTLLLGLNWTFFQGFCQIFSRKPFSNSFRCSFRGFSFFSETISGFIWRCFSTIIYKSFFRFPGIASEIPSTFPFP